MFTYSISVPICTVFSWFVPFVFQKFSLLLIYIRDFQLIHICGLQIIIQIMWQVVSSVPQQNFYAYGISMHRKLFYLNYWMHIIKFVRSILSSQLSFFNFSGEKVYNRLNYLGYMQPVPTWILMFCIYTWTYYKECVKNHVDFYKTLTFM